MIYIVLCRYKSANQLWRIVALPETFDDELSANIACRDFAERMRGMTWLMECELPSFVPQLKVVDNEPMLELVAVNKDGSEQHIVDLPR